MSNTYRNFINRSRLYRDQDEKHKSLFSDTRDGYQNKQCSIRKRKMKPYTKDVYNHKFKTENYFGSDFRRTGFEHKEEVRNANRSRKKAMRQYLKEELKKELENL